MTNEKDINLPEKNKRYTPIAVALFVVFILSIFIGISDMERGAFDLDLGWFLFGTNDNEFDIIAWVIVLGFIPSTTFIITIIKKTDNIFKTTQMYNNTLVNSILVILVPLNLYTIYYLYSRFSYLEQMEKKSSEKKVINSFIAFLGLTSIALALTLDEIKTSGIGLINGDLPSMPKSYSSVMNNKKNDLGLGYSDEILNLKSLLDKGVIDQEEFKEMKTILIHKSRV